MRDHRLVKVKREKVPGRKPGRPRKVADPGTVAPRRRRQEATPRICGSNCCKKTRRRKKMKSPRQIELERLYDISVGNRGIVDPFDLLFYAC